MPHEQDRIEFPNGPQTALERTIGELVDHAQEVLATQGRLRGLLRANRLVVAELDLPTVLRRIVEAALELVDARYGAMGVLAPDGTLEQFLHVGMPEDEVRAIGDLPRGRGLLGTILAAKHPLRLEHLGDDSRSAGFPEHHPPMDAFLGVPILVRGELFGNLYLTRDDGDSFSDEDEELLVSLAATAGAAINHARLFDESRRQQAWSSALTEVTTALMSTEVVDGLGVVVDRVTPLAEADFACVLVPDGPVLRIDGARGLGAEDLPGTIDAPAGTIAGRSMESGHVTTADLREEPPFWPAHLRWAVAIPFAASERPLGTLLLARGSERPRFTASDIDLAAEFAAQASVAIELAHGRRDRQELQRVEDRSRIARDLHDNVIQRLFAAGLILQSIEPAVPAALRQDVGDQIDAIDAAIAEIRTAVFALGTRGNDERQSIRHRVLDVVSEVGRLLTGPVSVTFVGAVDVMVPTELGDDIVAVVRESLTNVGRHARAASTELQIAIDNEHLTVRVDDDGRGIQRRGRASGTANLAARAAARGGRYVLDARPGGGTSMSWRVPLPKQVTV
ncbi:GAF domain-containing protein [Curtobacterium sp. VKM Ac-1393]|uniref:sensor histidine kinase n=1 Tax=Curtobacterium sp. VKM Ac-1393 TaxID=2783814 RepID=UPI00188B425D|nr:GAF domain-containing protein [Curtobacterium sp. VKM Ac-1393]MBF4609412.1 GAF domain-containing protein [Curtobacterium sp. VKM Ac-1393]